LLITDTILQTHLPHTGGSWLSGVLAVMRDGVGVRGCSHHAPIWEAPDDVRADRVIIGTARGAHEHYATIYRKAMTNHPMWMERLRVYGGGSLAFRDVLDGWTRPRHERMPGRPGLIVELHNDARAALLASGAGLSTFLHVYTYGEAGRWREPATAPQRWGVHALLDTANLHEAAAEIIGDDFAPERFPRHNVTPALDWMPANVTQWYDEEMLDWVEQADGGLATMMGRGPFEKAYEPVTIVNRRMAA